MKAYALKATSDSQTASRNAKYEINSLYLSQASRQTNSNKKSILDRYKEKREESKQTRDKRMSAYFNSRREIMRQEGSLWK